MEYSYHKAGYLNTDLDLFGEEPFDSIILELGGAATLLHYRREKREGRVLWFACIEARNSRNQVNYSPQGDILSLINTVKTMNPQAKAEWLGLRRRDFNIGWEAQNIWPQEAVFSLSSEIMKELAEINATLSVTLYPSSQGKNKDCC
jgi:hypothetical protein